MPDSEVIEMYGGRWNVETYISGNASSPGLGNDSRLASKHSFENGAMSVRDIHNRRSVL